MKSITWFMRPSRLVVAACLPFIMNACSSKDAAQLVEAELLRLATEGINDAHRIAQAIRRVVGNWVADKYRRRPMIVPTVIAVPSAEGK